MDEPASSTLTVVPRLSREDRDVAVVLVTVALCLTVIEYWGRRDGTGIVAADTQLGRLSAWAIVTIVAYVVPALVVARFVLHRPVRDLGLRVAGIGEHARVYAALFAVSLPIVVLASFADGFQDKYPFYDLAPGESFWPNLWIWWFLYCAQFVSLEFFFRGFIVHGLAPRFGWLSVCVMVVPYNMIHYGKPMPEALAAIVGGLVLGTLSYRTRSIWWGAALHISIALTMDVCALWHDGRLF
ncbi:MAG: lysostaphin resistance A-like protein [Actinomycetota bacterium]